VEELQDDYHLVLHRLYHYHHYRRLGNKIVNAPDAFAVWAVTSQQGKK